MSLQFCCVGQTVGQKSKHDKAWLSSTFAVYDVTCLNTWSPGLRFNACWNECAAPENTENAQNDNNVNKSRNRLQLNVQNQCWQTIHMVSCSCMAQQVCRVQDKWPYQRSHQGDKAQSPACQPKLRQSILETEAEMWAAPRWCEHAVLSIPFAAYLVIVSICQTWHSFD